MLSDLIFLPFFEFFDPAFRLAGDGSKMVVQGNPLELGIWAVPRLSYRHAPSGQRFTQPIGRSSNVGLRQFDFLMDLENNGHEALSAQRLSNWAADRESSQTE